MELNLEAKNKQEELIKQYLQENASETLADKINNGVKINKDGKTVINKKTLSSFIRYAGEEARKQAEKGTHCACVEDQVVYGWAIHYFEEDSIQGKLFNLDGSEYEPPKPIKNESTTPKVEVRQKPKEPSLFDFITEPEQKEAIEEDEESHIEEIDGQKVDTSTGEVISMHNQTFDKYLLKTISITFDGQVKLK